MQSTSKSDASRATIPFSMATADANTDDGLETYDLMLPSPPSEENEEFDVGFPPIPEGFGEIAANRDGRCPRAVDEVAAYARMLTDPHASIALTAREQKEVTELAWKREPETTAEARDAIMVVSNDNPTLKQFLKTLHVSGAQNSRVATKVILIAEKLVQHRLSLRGLEECSMDLDKEVDGVPGASVPMTAVHRRIRALQHTSVKVTKATDTADPDTYVWKGGNAPKVDENGAVIPQVTPSGDVNVAYIVETRTRAAVHCLREHSASAYPCRFQNDSSFSEVISVLGKKRTGHGTGRPVDRAACTAL